MSFKGHQVPLADSSQTHSLPEAKGQGLSDLVDMTSGLHRSWTTHSLRYKAPHSSQQLTRGGGSARPEVAPQQGVPGGRASSPPPPGSEEVE